MHSHQSLTLRDGRAGNTLLVAVLLIAILSLVGATVLQTVSNRYDYSQKAVGWSEALNAAEAGADFGFANCGWNLTGQPTWVGWKKFSNLTSNWVAVTDANDANNEIAAGRRIVYDLPAGSHLLSTGEGTTDLWYHVEVDSPPPISSRAIAGIGCAPPAMPVCPGRHGPIMTVPTARERITICCGNST